MLWGQARAQYPRMPEAEVDAEVLRTLLRDTVDEKSVPALGPDGEIQRYYLTDIPLDDPGSVERPARPFTLNLQEWTLTTKLLATALLLLLGGMAIFWPTSTNVPAQAASRAVATPSAQPAATATPDPRCDIKQYVAPVIPGQRAPLSFMSIDVAGTPYEVEPSIVCNREWQLAAAPGVASWWAGSFTNVVIAVPSLKGVKTHDVVVLRDNNAQARRFRVDTVGTVSRYEIEVLASERMGLTLIAPATGDERTVVWATYE
jgi:hypothetical protein